MKVKAKKLSPTVTRAEARKMLTLGGRQTSKEEVDRFMDEVKRGTPVMPIKFFCEFLEEWARLIGEPYPEERHPEENKERRDRREQAQHIFIQIRKSNFLWRRIYRGEPTRTKPCPVHKGRWSGCKLTEETECRGACQHGLDVTGWLK